MPQISIVSGIYSDKLADYRQTYPINLYPVALDSGLSKSYLRPCPGVSAFAQAPGADRGSIVWNGMLYRVAGTKLVRVYANGAVEELGTIPGAERAAMAKSVDRICIVTGGRAYYWSDGAGLERITDADFGRAIDVIFIDGYFLFVDEAFVFNAELSDPLAINPLSFGSAEVEGDPIVGIAKVRNEPYICGSETIEVLQNVGGAGFPFQRVAGAMITKGVVGRDAKVECEDALFFVGAGRGEAASVYIAAGGQAQRIATDDVDKRIQALSLAEQAGIVCETCSSGGQYFVLIHLPGETLVYDLYGSRAAGMPLWHVRQSNGGRYRVRGIQRAYGRWLAGDAIDGRLGELSDDAPDEYGETILREFSTPLGFIEAQGFIVHAAELQGISGRALGDPRVSLSISRNGTTWSQERFASAGKRGEHDYRPRWRQVGRADRQMSFRFRMEGGFTPARLDVTLEALSV